MGELTVSGMFSQTNVQEKFEKLLGEKAPGFISSVLQTVNNNKLLAKANPGTVLNAAATAASLDLPINQNLGFAWIVPYKGEAQFQMGWRGFVQLALRTGQYKKINVTEVHKNQFSSFNRLTEELDADFTVQGEGGVIGYVSYFELVNGMTKVCFWTKEEVTKHAKKYSQAYGTKYSPWSSEDTFDAMAKKTVLKSMISKWGIMGVEMQTAQLADQAIVVEDGGYKYADNAKTIDLEAENEETEQLRISNYIKSATTLEDLEGAEEFLTTDELKVSYSEKKDELTTKK